MLNIVISATLKNICKGNDIALNISIGIYNAVTNTSLRSKMNYNIYIILVKDFFQRFLFLNVDLIKYIGCIITYVSFIKIEDDRFNAGMSKAIKFELNIVIIIDSINANYCMTILY